MFPKLPPPPSPPAYLIFWKKISSVGWRPLDGSVPFSPTSFTCIFVRHIFFGFFYFSCAKTQFVSTPPLAAKVRRFNRRLETNNFRFFFFIFFSGRQKMKGGEEEVVGHVAPTRSSRNKCVDDERNRPTPTPTTPTPIPQSSCCSPDYDIPWRNYTDSERIHILNVLRRDVELRQIELDRVR
jgi:hypothetical protein